jgi:hypothetical protein
MKAEELDRIFDAGEEDLLNQLIPCGLYISCVYSVRLLWISMYQNGSFGFFGFHVPDRSAVCSFGDRECHARG